MKQSKPLHCVEMKSVIQAKLRKQHEGLSEEEIQRRRRVWLGTSDEPLAKWWRSVQAAKQPS
jgi:hypothetical protein